MPKNRSMKRAQRYVQHSSATIHSSSSLSPASPPSLSPKPFPNHNAVTPSTIPPPTTPIASTHIAVPPSSAQQDDQSCVNAKSSTTCVDKSSIDDITPYHLTTSQSIADNSTDSLSTSLSQVLNKLIAHNDNLIDKNDKYLNEIIKLKHENQTITSEAHSLSRNIKDLLSVIHRRDIKIEILNNHVKILNSNLIATLNNNDAMQYQINSLNKEISNLHLTKHYDDVLIQSCEKLLCYENLASLTLENTTDHCLSPAEIVTYDHTNLKPSDLHIILQGVALPHEAIDVVIEQYCDWHGLLRDDICVQRNNLSNQLTCANCNRVQFIRYKVLYENLNMFDIANYKLKPAEINRYVLMINDFIQPNTLYRTIKSADPTLQHPATAPITPIHHQTNYDSDDNVLWPSSSPRQDAVEPTINCTRLDTCATDDHDYDLSVDTSDEYDINDQDYDPFTVDPNSQNDDQDTLCIRKQAEINAQCYS